MGEKESQITLADVQRAFEIETIDYRARVMAHAIHLKRMYLTTKKKRKRLEIGKYGKH